MNNTKINHNINNELKLETGIGPFTDGLLVSILDRITSGDFREILIDKIVDPITEIINKKIKPYVYISIVLYSVVIVLMIYIIFLLKKRVIIK